jgi:hypothetical protein
VLLADASCGTRIDGSAPDDVALALVAILSALWVELYGLIS